MSQHQFDRNISGTHDMQTWSGQAGGVEFRLRRETVLALLIVAALGLGYALPSAQSVSPDTKRWVLVVLGGLLGFAPFAIGAFRNKFDIFEPVYLFAMSYLTLFVVRPIFDLTHSGGIRVTI